MAPCWPTPIPPTPPGGIDVNRIVIGFVLAGVAGCTGADPPAADESTYTLAVPSDEWVMSPVRSNAAKFLVFLELATPNAQGKLEGRLARRWTHSADYRDWTIHLRSDVRWHDGVPVTAQDVKFTVDLMTDPDVMPKVFNTGFFVYESARVVDDSTVVIRYKDRSNVARVLASRLLAGILSQTSVGGSRSQRDCRVGVLD